MQPFSDDMLKQSRSSARFWLSMLLLLVTFYLAYRNNQREQANRDVLASKLSRVGDKVDDLRYLIETKRDAQIVPVARQTPA